jgi:3-methylcrotonyl-CoA carboxylase alpha subunit
VSEIWKLSGRPISLGLAESKGNEWDYERRPGGWWVATRRSDGQRYRFQAIEHKGRLGVAAGGRLFDGLLEEKRRGPAGREGLGGDLVSEFPGKVRKILVGVGQKINVGDPVILMEAMKMEFTLRAPITGTVRNLLVQEGQQISPGTRFLDIDSEVENG